MVAGALAQSLPDIDFIAGFWASASRNFLIHRGFTHSLLFDLLSSLLLTCLVRNYFKSKIRSVQWFQFFLLQSSLHLFIDSCNAYGTGLFEPFSHNRISLNLLFVVDPFLWLFAGLAFIVLLILPSYSSKRFFWQQFCIIGISLYLACSVHNKLKIDRDIRAGIHQQKIEQREFFSTPTPLNIWLWYIVVKTDSGFYIGYRSVFDFKHCPIAFTYIAQQQSLRHRINDRSILYRLTRFSKGFFSLEKRTDTIVFNDLRFGQEAGWYNPTAGFVFQYYFGKVDMDNRLALQRGRFAHWSRASFIALFASIRGDYSCR
jgi:inner membrane protein